MSAWGRRYAKAAMEAVADAVGGEAQAAAKGAADLSADLKRFVALLADSPALHELLHNPMLKVGRQAGLDAVLRPLALVPLAQQLIGLLARNDRMHLLADISHQVEHLADQQLGRVRVRVRAAIMPTQAQIVRMSEILQRRLGKPVLVTVSVVPELLAGMTCDVGDLTFDSSLHSQLAGLTERLGGRAAAP